MTTNTAQEIALSCPVCGASITEGGQVNFNYGSPGTRARLYARVCQYTNKPGCINQESELIGEVAPSDCFKPGDDLKKRLDAALDNE